MSTFWYHMTSFQFSILVPSSILGSGARHATLALLRSFRKRRTEELFEESNDDLIWQFVFVVPGTSLSARFAFAALYATRLSSKPSAFPSLKLCLCTLG